MKYIFLLLLVALFSCTSEKKEDTTTANTSTQISEIQEAEPFSIVELFTSEGCSDCPPAEELLNKITKEAMANKTYVYPLAFHVDYWNKLGWKDVFSDSSFSNRQRKYRVALGNEVVYTPQMIVNGSAECVGSDEKRSAAIIDSFLVIKPNWYFTIQPNEKLLENGIIETEYEIIRGPIENDTTLYNICYALVERNLTTDITRGENKGLKLTHQNIVRVFGSHKITSNKGSFHLEFKNGKLSKSHSIISFIQDAKTMKIVGANLWNI